MRAILLVIAASVKRLFSGKDSPVVELDPTTAESAWASKDEWVLNYYASWCPHCQHYAPKYKELARKAEKKNLRMRFGAVDCQDYQGECLKHSVKAYPTILLHKSDGTSEKMTPAALDKWINKMDAFMPDNLKKTKNSVPNFVASEDPKPAKKEDPFKWGIEAENTPEARLADGLLALVVAMQQGSGPAATARAFSQLLAERLPTQSAREAVGRLTNKLKDGVDVGALAGAWATEEIPSFGIAVPSARVDPQEAKWRVCKNYTCGLWQLFHVLAAKMVQDRNGLRGMHGQAAEARDRLHAFVRDFFPCEVCRNHFLKSYDACEFRACDVDTGGAEVLQEWLWRLHNAVTARVRTVAGSEPHWPPEAACTTCTSDYTTAVSNFLVQTYVSGSSPPLLLQHEDSAGDSHMRIGLVALAVVGLIILMMTRQKQLSARCCSSSSQYGRAE
jgi:thiol oxidase